MPPRSRQARDRAPVRLATAKRYRYLLPFGSGVAMVFAYAPFSLPVLPFLGLVPLFLFFAVPRSVRQLALGALAFGVPYFAGNIYWLFYLARFTPAGVAGALGTLCMHGATFLVFAVGLNVTNHALRIPLAVSAPVFWVTAEYARTWGDFHFPWVTLGYSLSDWPRLIQHADLVGVYGLSWWLALVNTLVAALLVSRTSRRSRLANASILVLALAIPAAYGTVRWRQVEREIAGAPTLRVAVAQPNIPQTLKWRPGTQAENLRRLNAGLALAERLAPDLVVAPEAALPAVLPDDARRLPAQVPTGASPLLVGALRGKGKRIEFEYHGHRVARYPAYFNSAVLAGADRSILGTHDKEYLVPVAEQMPYKEVFGFLLPFMRKQFGRFLPGEGPHLLVLTDAHLPVRIGATVCYESLFPALTRRMAAGGANLIANLTNDAWFGRSVMSHQHLGFLVLRAIETRRSVARSANTGVSALIDPLGRVLQRSRLFERTALVGELPLLDDMTVYTRAGDVMVWLSYAAAVFLLVASWRRWKSRGGLPAQEK